MSVEFSREIADTICERIANGESLRAICSEDDMPNKANVFRWLAADETFRDQYARARETQADSLFDEILTIADTPMEGSKTKITANGIETTTGDMIEHRRLQVDARKWMAGKLQPKKYGDKITQELTGAGGSPLVPVLNVTIGKLGSEPSSETG
jgi:hypothetical protein